MRSVGEKPHVKVYPNGSTLRGGGWVSNIQEKSGGGINNNNNNFYLYSAIKSNQSNCSVALYNE